MSLYRNVHSLLELKDPASTAQVGQHFLVLPSDADRTEDHALGFLVFVDVTQNGGSESPAVSIRLETSHDGAHWVPAASSVELNGNDAISRMLPVEALGPFVRARSSLSGGARPEHTVTVRLACNGAFRLVGVPGGISSTLPLVIGG